MLSGYCVTHSALNCSDKLWCKLKNSVPQTAASDKKTLQKSVESMSLTVRARCGIETIKYWQAQRGCCISPQNKTGQLKKGCPVCCFHIINLNETNRKRVRKAGCPSRSVCRTQKSHFLHEPASLEPKNVMFGTPRIALLKKRKRLMQIWLDFATAPFVKPDCLFPAHSWIIYIADRFDIANKGRMIIVVARQIFVFEPQILFSD